MLISYLIEKTFTRSTFQKIKECNMCHIILERKFESWIFYCTVDKQKQVMLNDFKINL